MSGREEARLGGKRWNRIVDDKVRWYRQKVDMLKAGLLADGYPAFSQPVSPYQAYQALVALRQAGDPTFWNDPRAQARLAELSLRFGQAPLGGPLGDAGPYPGGSTQYAPRPGRTY